MAAGDIRTRSNIGAHSWCSPAKANSISDWIPAARATRHPDARSDQVLQQRRLSHARLAPHHQSPALAAPTAREQPIKNLTLTAPTA